MKNLKRIFVAVLTISVFSANAGIFTLPVLAYEKNGVDLPVKANNTPDNGEPALNKTNFLLEESKGLSSDKQKRAAGLEKSLNIENEKQNYVPGEVLVKFKNNKVNLQTVAGRVAALNFSRSKSLEKKEDLGKNNISVLTIRDAKTVEQKIAELKKDPNVEYVQPNFQYYPLSIDTNDTYKTDLWGLDNSGQTVNMVSGTNDADIDAPEAWAINEGTNSQIIVAVIDSGVAYNHPDLAANMWDGTSCVGSDKNGNAIGGGCQHGFDYEDNDKLPLPTSSSHGTHIAGTIAAVKNNGKGIMGVAPNAKIMAIKSSLTTTDNVKSINFAQQNGAKVINASWGCYASDEGGTHAVCGGSGDYRDAAMINAIASFSGLFIVAAGNGDGDTDSGGDNHDNGQTLHSYPCDHTANNVICVSATDQNDDLADFSDYGAVSVDVGAPGTNIYSSEGYRLFDEDFEGVALPSVGSKFTQSGDNSWGTLSNGSNKALFGDYAYLGNYRNNILSSIDSASINLIGKPDSYLNFEYYCDIEEGYDFLGLYFYNGISWNIVDAFSGKSDGAKEYNLANYVVNNFQFRFLWITDESNPKPYYGCYVDNVKVIDSASSDSYYQFMDGTSMAAPHVAGLAALVWGYRPDLSSTEVKNTILTTGDSLASLAGKTVTGKRINAYNALNSVKPITLSSITITTPATKMVYTVGDPLDITGLVVTGTYSDNSTSTESVAEANIAGFDSAVPAIDQVLTITVGGKTTTYTVDVVAAPIVLTNIAITTPATKLIYTVGDLLDITGLVVTGTYSDASTKRETITTANVSGFNSSAPAAGQVLTITVGGKIATYTVDIVAVPDTIAPVITLNGANPLDLTVGGVFADPGATALDNVDGDITANIVVGGDIVDTSATSTYSITYTVEDAAGNEAVKTRTVNVNEASIEPDTMAPVITLTGANPMNLTVGDTFIDPGATANDNVDGSVAVSVSGSVNTGVVGIYSITYTAKDAAGNEATATRTVNVAAVLLQISGEEKTDIKTTSATITWTTSRAATSRVIYDTVSHPGPLSGAAPNYGYKKSTTEASAKALDHSVIVSGLSANTTYYLRPVSADSSETVGDEVILTTKKRSGGGGGGGGSSKSSGSDSNVEPVVPVAAVIPAVPQVQGAATEEPNIAALQNQISSLILQIKNVLTAAMARGIQLSPALLASLQAMGVSLDAPSPKITGDWRLGDTNAEIRLLQTALAKDPLVYPQGTITGFFGPLTQAAVYKFQSKNGLPLTGFTDLATRGKLNGILAQAN